jgi:hypothetical protein
MMGMILSLILGAVVFYAPAPDSLGPADNYVYNRALEKPSPNLMPKYFLGEDASRGAIAAALMRWGKPPLGAYDDPWAVDQQFKAARLRRVVAACDSTTPLGDLYEVPLEEQHPIERGRVRSYILVRRARNNRELPPLDPPVLQRVDGQCVITTRKK